MNSGATFSPDRIFRYRLWRTWDALKPMTLVTIGLNPSTADETQDDPTIRRCIRFAQRERCGSLVMLNLFAYRSTNPRELARRYLLGDDPTGPSNDAVILQACTLPCVRVVAAWGAHGRLHWRDEYVCELLSIAGVEIHCLGLTKTGLPRHPLYLRNDSPLVPFRRGSDG